MEGQQGSKAFSRIKTGIILLYFILNGLLLVLAFQINVDDLKLLVRMARYIPYFKYVASANMLLIIIVLSMYYFEIKKLNRRKKAAEQEVLNIKSKLYDMAEEKRDVGKKSDQEDYYNQDKNL